MTVTLVFDSFLQPTLFCVIDDAYVMGLTGPDGPFIGCIGTQRRLILRFGLWPAPSRPIYGSLEGQGFGCWR